MCKWCFMCIVSFLCFHRERYEIKLAWLYCYSSTILLYNYSIMLNNTTKLLIDTSPTLKPVQACSKHKIIMTWLECITYTWSILLKHSFMLKTGSSTLTCVHSNRSIITVCVNMFAHGRRWELMSNVWHFIVPTPWHMSKDPMRHKASLQ